MFDYSCNLFKVDEIPCKLFMLMRLLKFEIKPKTKKVYKILDC